MQTFLALNWWQWTALAFAAWAVLSYYHPRFWIKLDTGAFIKDGSAQSLGFVFHRQRMTWRSIAFVLPALLCCIPLGLHYDLFAWGQSRYWWWLAAPYAKLWLPFFGLLAGAGGYWLWYFNPALNVARNLEYIDQYHVSWAANASWLDRHLWREAWEQVHLADRSHQFDFVPGEPDEAVKQKSRELLKSFLRKSLITGVCVFIVFIILFFIFA